jgi:predicted secreted protein
MRWTSIIAIYTLFWVLSAFLVMPFGVRTMDEGAFDKVPGQADSAPAHFRRAASPCAPRARAGAVRGLFYANYVYGWISPSSSISRRTAAKPLLDHG